MNIKMNLIKSTKNTHVYRADNDEAHVQTVYINKEGLPKQAPKSIVVTVDPS